jgi:hypothetical protein
MGDWNLFFATSAGSAATLVGPLFVATQLHIGVFSDPKNRWASSTSSRMSLLSVPKIPQTQSARMALVRPDTGSSRTHGVASEFVGIN